MQPVSVHLIKDIHNKFIHILPVLDAGSDAIKHMSVISCLQFECFS
jgi:hypothetical protein